MTYNAKNENKGTHNFDAGGVTYAFVVGQKKIGSIPAVSKSV